MKCRHCGRMVIQRLIDLGASPPSNAYLSVQDLSRIERYYPLRVFVCTTCWLAQTEDFAKAEELFSADYAYFSSVSNSWLEHAAIYSRMIVERLALNSGSHVIEVAANDGYLLKNFVAAGIPCLGVEPTASTAAVAEALGIPVLREFFGLQLAVRLVAADRRADLIVCNNVFAHVPDVNDFAAGLKTALKQGGTVTLEFPHLGRLIQHTQFDTIYHEHFSYLSLHAARNILETAQLRIYDVQEISTHGGSLRIFVCHREENREVGAEVHRLLAAEVTQGMLDVGLYEAFQTRADRLKDDLVGFLIATKKSGKTVAGYGAAAKGNTLLNYGGVKRDLLPFVVDAAESKQRKFLPGSRIPILAPQALRERQPDYVLILPWNIADEVVAQHGYISEWGGRFVVAVPELRELHG